MVERTLSVRAQELESAIVSRRKIDGLENLSLLVKLHIELMQWDFHGLNDQITTAINLQKAHLDLDTARKEVGRAVETRRVFLLTANAGL